MSAGLPPGFLRRKGQLYAQAVKLPAVPGGKRSNNQKRFCCVAHGQVWRARCVDANAAGIAHPDPTEFRLCNTTPAPIRPHSDGLPVKHTVLFAHVADLWLAHERNKDRKPERLGELQRQVNCLKLFFGTYSAQQFPTELALTLPVVLRDKGGARKKGIGQHLATGYIATAKNIYDYAQLHEYTNRPRNIFENLDALVGKRDSFFEAESLSVSQVYRVVRHLPPHWQPVVWLMRLLGMRISEAFGLRLCDMTYDGRRQLNIEWQGGKIFRSRDADGNEIVCHTKQGTKDTDGDNAPVRRVIAVPRILQTYLLYVVRRDHSGVEDPSTCERPLIINPYGKKTSQKAFRDAWAKALIEEGLGQRRPNDRLVYVPHHLRKCLSDELQVRADVHGEAVSRQLGHRGLTVNAAMDVSRTIYTLRQHWNTNVEFQRRMLEIADAIDSIIRNELPNGLDDHDPAPPAADIVWLNTVEAAKALGVHRAVPPRMVGRGLIRGAVQDLRGRHAFRYPQAEIDRLATEASDCVSVPVAAFLSSQSEKDIRAAIAFGRLESRPDSRDRPMVTRMSLMRFIASENRAREAFSQSVSDDDAAASLGLPVAKVRTLKRQGLLKRHPDAPFDTVLIDSVEALKNSGECPDWLDPDVARGALPLTDREFVLALKIGVLVTNDLGQVSAASVEQALATQRLQAG